MNSTKLLLYSPVEMADVSAKGKQRGVPSVQTAKLKTEVDRWVTKGALTAVDLLSVEQVKVRLHTLDIKFKRYHMDVIDSLEDESEMEKEHEVMDTHESRVAHSTSSPTTSSKPAATTKTESKELNIL